MAFLLPNFKGQWSNGMKRDVLTLHGTCIDVKGNGVLICGKPGAGKSSLALQLMDSGAILVADDQTLVGLENYALIAQSPLSLKGLLEVRGVGLCSFPIQEKSQLKLCVEICETEELERLPEPLFIEYHTQKVPLLKLSKYDPLGAIKVELKLCCRDESNVI